MDRSGSRELKTGVPVAPAGSQTLLRGLDLLEAVTRKSMALPELSTALGLNRSTVHRLASALVYRGYLKFVPRTGYMLGAKLLELGYAARQQVDLARVARPHLELLADSTEDTVHFGILDNDKALYLDKISGRRRVEIGSRVGERHPLSSTGLGKALILDRSPAEWHTFYLAERGDDAHFASWSAAMRQYMASGHTFDLEENEDRIRCIGAPVRDATGSIVAAVSLSSVSQYMDDARMRGLVGEVKRIADAISCELGWQDEQDR